MKKCVKIGLPSFIIGLLSSIIAFRVVDVNFNNSENIWKFVLTLIFCVTGLSMFFTILSFIEREEKPSKPKPEQWNKNLENL